MKKMFVMSVVGPDSPGTIKSIAETTRGHGGEWATSKVMRLDGQMTAMMKVVVEESAAAGLMSSLEEAFPELTFFCVDAADKEIGAMRQVGLVVDCKDRPGLTKEISGILSNLDVIVENMECNRAHVSTLGEAVFTAKLALSVPESLRSETVAEEIETLSEDVRVSILS